MVEVIGLFGEPSPKTGDDHLKASSSLTRRAPPPSKLAEALLTSMMQDITGLKATMSPFLEVISAQQKSMESLADTQRCQIEFNTAQIESNAAQKVVNQEFLGLIAAHNALAQQVANLVTVVIEIDARLHVIDGKRSIEDSEAGLANEA